MPRTMSRLLSQLSRADLERLLATKSEVESLEARREELVKELAVVEKKLAKLEGGALGNGRRKAKKTAKKTVKKAVRKAPARGKKAVKKPRVKLEDVVVALLEKQGAPMSFQDILATIVKGKLFVTRSKQFDNVLRRTLSTSKKVKRVSRGVYGL